MELVQLALTEKRRISSCSDYLFPEEYYDIPGVEEFRNFEAVKNHARNKLLPYAGKKVMLFINGGMSVEVLSAIQAAAFHHIHLQVLHFNRQNGNYLLQPVIWKPLSVNQERKQVSLTLCRGRHGGMPETVIFEFIQDEQIFDFEWQKEQAKTVLEYWKEYQVRVYVSGLTQLAISVLNAAFLLEIPIIFYHYDYDTETYIAQTIDECMENTV